MNLTELYARAAEASSHLQSDGELAAWQAVLGGFEISEVDAAIRRWQADTTSDYRDRPRGSYMPSAAEMKTLIEGFRRSEIARAQQRFIACGQNGCEDGWTRVFHGQTRGGNAIDPRVGAVRRCPCWKEFRECQGGACEPANGRAVSALPGKTLPPGRRVTRGEDA